MTTIQPCRPCIAEITFIAITMHAKEILGAMFFHLAAVIYLCGEVSGVFPFDRKNWISVNEFNISTPMYLCKRLPKNLPMGKNIFKLFYSAQKVLLTAPSLIYTIFVLILHSRWWYRFGCKCVAACFFLGYFFLIFCSGQHLTNPNPIHPPCQQKSACGHPHTLTSLLT